MNKNYKISESNFFRLSFLLQDRSESTAISCLNKLIEYVMFIEKKPMNVDDIREAINNKFSLQFTNDEIIEATSKLDLNNGNVMNIDGMYSLSAEFSNKYSKNISIEVKLKELITIFINEKKENTNVAIVYDLISRYLYFCFNSNLSDIMALINSDNRINKDDFDANDDEKKLINEFLLWDNEDKNEFIYKVVSYCYTYCTLTTKKNLMFSGKIFSNKTFYLDANIIFRLAGLNKEDRQKTIISFKNKCEELKINLVYTNETYTEIVRVIDKDIKWLQSIHGSAKPPKIQRNTFEMNDIYNVYSQWCSNYNNKPGDFGTFRRYLISLIDEEIKSFKYRDINNSYNDDEVNKLSDGILQYKLQQQSRMVNEIGAITDAKNVLHILKCRKNNDTSSIFSTQSFLISADRNLTYYLNDRFPGIPISVMPSIWLMIMLKFTGRTDNDYKSFCLFMNLRYSNNNSVLDITKLLQELKLHTSDVTIKEMIIKDVYYNISKYEECAKDDRYEEIVNDSFKRISEQDKKELKELYDLEISKIQERHNKDIIEKEELSKSIKADEDAEKMAIKDFGIERAFKVIVWSLVLVPVIIVIILLVYFLLSKVFKALPSIPYLDKTQDNVNITIFFVGIMSPAAYKIIERIKYTLSEEYRKKRITQIKNKYIKLFK